MRILLATIHNSSNYGGALQAFATLKYLEKEGHSVEIADYRNTHIMKGLWPVRLGMTKYELLCTVHDMLHIKSRMVKRKRFLDFYRKHFHYTAPFQRISRFSGGDAYDICVSGSDQIWNPLVTNGFPDPVYFLRMAPSGIRKVSISSSLGDYKFDNGKFNSLMRKWLEEYTCISVREEASAAALERHCGIHAEHTPDPVFLLKAEEWDKYVAWRADVRKPYLLVYPMKHTGKLVDAGRRLAEKWSLFMVCIGDCAGLRDKSYIEDAGPEQFLGLIRNAEFVLTNSFHALAFSVIFEKPFFCVTDAHNPGRLRDFLRIMHLERYGGKLEECMGQAERNIDFNVVKPVMNGQRAKLVSYISKILEGGENG